MSKRRPTKAVVSAAASQLSAGVGSSLLGTLAGQVKSERKAQAARLNGKLGGRPRKDGSLRTTKSGNSEWDRLVK